MQYLKLELFKFRRIMLNSIEHFKMDLTEPVQIILGTNGSGKAQPLNSFIKVPGGWDLMKNMKIGTPVIAKDGSITKVNGVFPQGEKQIFKFTFADGRTCQATADHLWKVYIGGKKYPIQPKIIDTTEIIRLLKTNTYGHLLWVDLIESEQNQDVELPVDPYVLGVILGDGNTDSGITITHPDEFIMDKISNKLGGTLLTIPRKESKDKCLTYSIANNSRLGPKSNYIINYLKDCGLMHKKSYEKFIPGIYLHASTNQRLQLLQGLMDTDGYVDVQSTCSYSTTSNELALHVQYLVRSLGGIAKISTRIPFFTVNGIKKQGRLAYQINIRFKKSSDLFTLPRKKERTNDNTQYSGNLKLRIESVSYSYTGQTQCISIEHPEHLYVTDEFIVTHNTSLLQELSPLPGASNDYFKGGFKLIEINHNSKHYILKSDFENGQHHSFICDGVELNPGGTVTVQKDLVKLHFSITSDIRELLISQSGFHKMSTSERRYWFTKLCDTNYDYAISVYNKIKERARDTTGALKLAKKRLGFETTNLITEQEQKDIQNRCNDLLSFLDHLMQFRSNQNFNDDFDLKNQSRKNNELMTEIALTIHKLKKSFINNGVVIKHDEIVKKTVENQTRYQLAKETIDSLMQSFNALEEKVKVIKAQAGTDIESLQTSLQTLQDKQQLLKNQLVFDTHYDNPNTLLTTVNNLEDIIFNIFNQIDSNENSYYSRMQYEKDSKDFAKTQEDIASSTSTLNKITAFITTQEEIRSHDKTQCPNCNHAWNAGFDQINYDKAFVAKENIQSKLDELYTVSAEIKERMDKTLIYFNLLKDYKHLVQGYPQLSKLWQAIEADNNISLSPKTVTNKVQLFKKDLFTSVEISTLNEKIFELKTHVEIAEKVKQQDTSLTLKQRDELSEQITEQNNILTSTRQNITLLNKQNDLLNQINELCAKLEKLIAVNESNCVKLVEYERVAAINDIIKSVQITLSKEQSILSDVKLQRALINDLTNQITILEKQELAAKMLCSELSPIDGLIAEGMTGFIRSFVFQMNKIIKKVWLYPLEVLPCGLTVGDSVELDYKFPTVVQNNHKDPVEDVSKGSSAMTEIIDLSFKIVAMKYLGLQGTPLMLDELGRAMDTEHKIKIIELIKQINDQHIFSQIFMISHDILHYGALSNTQICVLCDANILLPKGCVFNQHVTIE